MTQYEYLIIQRNKLIEALRNSGKDWISKKVVEIVEKINGLSIEEAGRDYRPTRR